MGRERITENGPYRVVRRCCGAACSDHRGECGDGGEMRWGVCGGGGGGGVWVGGTRSVEVVREGGVRWKRRVVTGGRPKKEGGGGSSGGG